MNAQNTQAAPVQNPEKAAQNKRLESIGWGLFLIMLGGFALVPNATIPKGLWSIGVGVIMLGLNVTRYVYKIRMSGFTTVLGIIAIISGVLELMGMNELGGAIFLIILGVYLLVKPWFDKRQLFGKAEDSQ
jgi:drug/metabolite transporter (DMT)-like permease